MDARQKIEPVTWRRKEDYGWWVYYETKAYDDLEPLYDAQTIASKEAELAAREAEIARLRRALMHLEGSTSDSYASGFARAALTKQPPKD